MAKRNALAQHSISAKHNRLMCTLVKLLWLCSPQGTRSSPENTRLLKSYGRVQHRILVEDQVLSKAGIPLQKLNSKTVRDFTQQQERLLNLHSTTQPKMLTTFSSVKSADIRPAPHQPTVLHPPDYPVMTYDPTPNTAGTKVLKERTDVVLPVSPSATQPNIQKRLLPHPLSPDPQPQYMHQ